MTVDAKVYALAEWWILDVSPHPEPDPADEMHKPITQSLAACIQKAIEDWVETEQRPGGMLS